MALTKWFALVLFLLAPAFANAVIIDGYFTGWVMGGGITDHQSSKDLAGEELSGRIWYDTDLMPSVDPHRSDAAFYSSNTNKWLGITYYIAGRTIDVSNSIVETYDSDYIYEEIVISSFYNSFATQKFVKGSGYTGDFFDINSYIGFHGGPVAINNNGLLQNFSWVDDGSSAGRGELYGFVGHAGDEYSIGIEIYLTRLDVSVRDNVPVPEPSAIILLLSGLFMLFIKTRTTNSFHHRRLKPQAPSHFLFL